MLAELISSLLAVALHQPNTHPECVSRPDFSLISPGVRDSVRQFYVEVVAPYGLAREQAEARLRGQLQALTPRSYTGSALDGAAYLEDKRRQRKAVLELAQAQAKQQKTAFRARYEAFIAALPSVDRLPAREATSPVVCVAAPRSN